MIKFVAIDPATGRHLREATEAEAGAYKSQLITMPKIAGVLAWSTWGKPVRVGHIVIDWYETDKVDGPNSFD